MTRARAIGMEWLVLCYFLSYLPNVVLTRVATSTVHASTQRPLTGLEVLPSSLILNLSMTLLFVYFAGWCDKLYGSTIPVDGDYLNFVGASRSTTSGGTRHTCRTPTDSCRPSRFHDRFIGSPCSDWSENFLRLANTRSAGPCTLIARSSELPVCTSVPCP